MSASLAAVPLTVWTKPEATSTPTWAFIPKCHWLPFFVWCISGSRLFCLFLVEGGAAMIVASIILPCRINRPRSSSIAPTSSNSPFVKSCRSVRQPLGGRCEAGLVLDSVDERDLVEPHFGDRRFRRLPHLEDVAAAV